MKEIELYRGSRQIWRQRKREIDIERERKARQRELCLIIDCNDSVIKAIRKLITHEFFILGVYVTMTLLKITEEPFNFFQQFLTTRSSKNSRGKLSFVRG